MKELGKRLARGEASAMAELYDACSDRLHHYLTVRLGDRNAASDVLQEVFLRIVKGRRKFRSVENPVAYVFTIARNESIRWQGRRRNLLRASELNADDLFVVGASDPTATIESAELAADALNQLEGDAREIVVLKLYGDLTFREIAEITETPAATVATKYRRTLEQLRPWLEKQVR